MASLKAIKSKIRSIDKTRKVTKAMEAVSAAKMRKAQMTAIGGRSYAKAAVGILSRVGSAGTLKSHIFMEERLVTSALYMVITSDKGLAGGLNSGVLKATMADIRSLGLSENQVHIIAIGRKANDFFGKRGFTVDTFFPNIDGTIDTEMIRRTVEEALLQYRLGGASTVRVAFQNFVSTFEQRPTVRTMLPFSLTELERLVEAILPVKGVQFVERAAPNDYTVEPSADEIIDVLIPQLASIFVYHALLESAASEHSARMVAMKSASDKARDVTKELTLDFNKARQAGITREVSEIIGGIEAMA